MPPGQRGGQSTVQPIPPASGRRRVREHAGVPAHAGATKEKPRSLAQIQTERARGTARVPAAPGPGLTQLPFGERIGGRGWRAHTLPEHAEHELTRTLSHLQADAGHTRHTDFPHAEQAHTTTRPLQTGRWCPLETRATLPPTLSHNPQTSHPPPPSSHKLCIPIDLHL